jgi:hypothetical protein
MTYRIDDLEIPAESPFCHDALDRQPLVEFLSSLIKRLNGPFVMALDSPWGTGKTTLVRMLMADLQSKEFQCTYFNAWKVDYVTDPLVALVSSIDRIDLGTKEAGSKFKSHLKTVKKVTTLVAKRGLMAATKALTLGALDIEGEYEAAASELASDTVGDIVDAFNHESELLEKFRAELEAAVTQLPAASKEPNLVFFIDELDRCRPTFAIELLERIKHLFDIPNIIFVLSIDKQQLEASTAAVYGSAIPDGHSKCSTCGQSPTRLGFLSMDSSHSGFCFQVQIHTNRNNDGKRQKHCTHRLNRHSEHADLDGHGSELGEGCCQSCSCEKGNKHGYSFWLVNGLTDGQTKKSPRALLPSGFKGKENYGCRR